MFFSFAYSLFRHSNKTVCSVTSVYANYSYTKKTFISFSRQCTAGPALWRGPAVPASLPCAGLSFVV